MKMYGVTQYKARFTNSGCIRLLPYTPFTAYYCTGQRPTEEQYRGRKYFPLLRITWKMNFG